MSALKDSLLNSGAMIKQGGYSFEPSTRAAITQPISTWPSFSLGFTVKQLEPMEQIFSEIEAALAGGLYHAALVVTLTVPDICAALIHPKGLSPKGGYAAWFNENLPEYADALSGEDAHRMRSGFLHQARSTRSDMAWRQIAFGIGGPTQLLMRGNAINGVSLPDTYLIDLIQFCQAMVEKARAWLLLRQDDANLKTNLPRVVRRRPEGMPPLFSGLTVIA